MNLKKRLIFSFSDYLQSVHYVFNHISGSFATLFVHTRQNDSACERRRSV